MHDKWKIHNNIYSDILFFYKQVKTKMQNQYNMFQKTISHPLPPQH